MILQDIVTKSAQLYPNNVAIVDSKNQLTYQEMDLLANSAARALTSLGVVAGDRVAIWIEKSTYVVVMMQAILRIGAVYVPIDPLSPPVRAKIILEDCKVRTIVTSRIKAEEVLTGDLEYITCFSLEGSWQGLSWQDLKLFSDAPLETCSAKEEDLAYILYTSGSTGKPKGVCISHLNALAFIEWAVETLDIKPQDNLSNHAPFHFDLSVLDIYASFWAGATVYLISEVITYIPKKLVDFIVSNQITIWYSVPSVLILMINHGNWLETNNSLRAILFAGEPFGIKYLRQIRSCWPNVRLLNLYGPTETNVCTFYEVTEIPEKRTTPMPIGIACCGDEVWIEKENGERGEIGEQGELIVAGPTVMLGYWGQPPQTNTAYRTGDVVRLQDDGNYVYLGRRDHLVKIRGYRVELGEIESVLLEHPNVQEVAVIVSGVALEARLVAFVVLVAGTSLTLLEIKRHCSKRLPRYMIVDEVNFISKAPRTSTGKFDKKELFSLKEST